MFWIQLIAVLYIATMVGFSVWNDWIEELGTPKGPDEDYSSRKYNQKKATRLKKVAKRLKFLCLLGITLLAIIIGFFTSVFFTNEQQTGFTEVFGHTESITTSGMHFKVPFVGKIHIMDSTIKGIAIGYDEETEASKYEDSLMITSDFNFVNIDFFAEYKITDPIEYYYGSSAPELILKNILQASIRNIVGLNGIDQVLTVGKAQIESDVYADAIQELAKHHTGLTLLSVTIQDSEPPTADVKAAFDNVETKRQKAEDRKNEAKRYENSNIPNAEADAEAIIATANAEKIERENQATEEVAHFNALYDQYCKTGETFKTKLYYDTIKQILPNMEIIISDDQTIIVKGDGLGMVQQQLQ